MASPWTTKFEDQFKRVLSAWLSGKLNVDVEVLTYSEETYDIGYCETCSYITTEVWIEYSSNGETKEYKYNGNLADLISELGEVEV